MITDNMMQVNGYHQAVINWTTKPQSKVWISDEVEDLSLPTFISSETDSNGVSIEQDLIDVDDWMLDGLPKTNYKPVGVAAEYGLSNADW